MSTQQPSYVHPEGTDVGAEELIEELEEVLEGVDAVLETLEIDVKDVLAVEVEETVPEELLMADITS